MIKSQEIRNKFKVYKLVKDHFSLTDESLNLFKFRLFYEPHISPEYSKILNKFATKDDPLRARIKIPGDSIVLEKMDSGWKLFRENFSRFVSYYGLTYSDFKNNKVFINKQQIKLMKALVDFYIKEKKGDGWYVYTEDTIKKTLENIGKFKITKREVELVLSLNFADWFLCSTSENWCSCLNLESSYEDTFWSGLPGLIGDKNRAILYITDGSSKNYGGIVVDKLLNRAWTLTLRKKNEKLEKRKRNNSKILVLTEYPNRLGLSDMAKEFFGENFINSSEVDSSFISRYYIENLFHEINGDEFTSYIYQDNTLNIIGNKNKASLKPGGYSYLKYGGSGLSRYNGIGKSMDTNIFTFDRGLSYLVENETNLANVGVRNDYYCDSCGCGIDEDNVCFGLNDEPFCEHCWNEVFTVCNCCEQTIYTDDSIEVNNISVCEHCFNKYYFTCENCGDIYHKDDSVHIENLNRIICNYCFETDTNFYTCDECASPFKKIGIEIYIEDEKKYFCSEKCHDLFYDVKYVDIGIDETKKAS